MEIVVRLEPRQLTNDDFKNNDEQGLERRAARNAELDAEDLEDFKDIEVIVKQIIIDAAKIGIPVLKDYDIHAVTADNTGHEFTVYNIHYENDSIVYSLRYF